MRRSKRVPASGSAFARLPGARKAFPIASHHFLRPQTIRKVSKYSLAGCPVTDRNPAKRPESYTVRSHAQGQLPPACKSTPPFSVPYRPEMLPGRRIGKLAVSRFLCLWPGGRGHSQQAEQHGQQQERCFHRHLCFGKCPRRIFNADSGTGILALIQTTGAHP